VSARALVGLALVLAGCARVNVESKKRADYDRKLDRTLVVFTAFDRFSKDYRQLLHDRARDEFAKRGVTIQFATTPDGLGLEDDPSFDAQAKEFNASTVLIVRPVSGTVDAIGAVLAADLDAQLYDVASRKRVWRAKIRYTAGGSLNSDGDRVDKLVNGITSALTSDGLLLALEAPGAPPTAASPPPPAADASAPRSPNDPQATTGFPHVMIGREIASHFDRHRTIEATVGPQRMTILLRPDNRVERDCPGCRITHADGQMSVDVDRSLVCFRWSHTWFPDSGCYEVVQTADNRFMMRGTAKERSIEYSPNP